VAHEAEGLEGSSSTMGEVILEGVWVGLGAVWVRRLWVW